MFPPGLTVMAGVGAAVGGGVGVACKLPGVFGVVPGVPLFPAAVAFDVPLLPPPQAVKTTATAMQRTTRIVYIRLASRDIMGLRLRG
jgi:hypothetical protein